MSRRIFIGDVHGHYDGLMQLLEQIHPDQDDRIYFVGDLIDRGPSSAQVIDLVRQHAYPCVLGNHEQLLLNAFARENTNGQALHGWLYCGGQATLASYKNDLDRLTEHIHWLQTLPLYLDLEDIWLVHAGLDPALSVDEQTAEECCWIREIFHSEPNPYFKDKLIITGHTITFTFPDIAPGQIVEGPGWLDIDTGAYHPKSGWLTALDIDNEIVHQANVFEGSYRQRSLEEACSPFTRSRRRVVA